MGSIDMAVVTAASSVEAFSTRCPCGTVQQQRSSPNFLISARFRPLEFRKKSASSSGVFTDLSRRFSHVVPLRSLPDNQGNPSAENPTSNSKEPKTSRGSKDGSPYVPGDKQKQSITEEPKKTAAEIAMEKAAAYKKLKKLGPSSTSGQVGQASSVPPPPKLPPETDSPKIEILRGQNIQSRLQSSNSSSPPSTPSASSPPLAMVRREGNAEGSESQDGKNIDVLKFIEEKMAAGERELNPEIDQAPTPPPSKGKELEPVSLAAFERAKAYKQQQSEMVAALQGVAREESSSSNSKESGTTDQSASASGEKVMEIEIVTRDGVIKRKVMNAEEQMRAFSNIKDVKRKGVSGIDFAGLGFADKKKSGRPAGLSEGFVAPPTGALPEVEILTRDAGNPQTETEEQAGQGPEQLYKPKVSTWGVFPRPADISKTYGGGRTIRPGENLETEEERQTREARTQKLLADYKKVMGLDVDPKMKAEAEQAVRRGDGLMDDGRLRDALPFYELAMKKMPAKTELHGRAALQAAVCLDSLSRYDEARQIYERLLGHPNGAVSKQARRFLFGFKAMEKLKVDGQYKWDTSIYRKYFDSFADGYNSTYKADTEEETSENLLPYALLLLCPILLVVALAASNSS
ncbi:unnamed protein product [Calypogeia fissa]